MPRTISVFDWAKFVYTMRSEQYLDVTQEQLARYLGVSASTVSKWERGAVTPQPKHRWALWRLARRIAYPRPDWPRKPWRLV